MLVFFTSIIFILSSAYVIFVDYTAISIQSFQKALVLPTIFLILISYRLPKIVKTEGLSFEKWLFVFWGNVVIQMLVISTGGLQSPFLILLHFSMIGLSLLFNFSFAFLFLIFTMLVIAIDGLVLHQTIRTLFLDNPGSVILEATSLFAIVPIAYIISYKYHIKDWLFTKLRERVVADEAILENLSELIIITDRDLNILSVNDAVERTLMQSRSELLNKQLFNALLLKDKNGKIVTKETFSSNGNISHRQNIASSTFTLFNAAITQKQVAVQMQPIHDIEAKINQISVIISFIQNPTSSQPTTIIEEKARVKYEALIENLQKSLYERKESELWRKTILLKKIEEDIYTQHMLQEHGSKTETLRIDLAKLCKKVTLLEKDFAKTFGIKINFSLRNFGMKDIAPFLAGNFTASPEELTGPFFTVACDVKKMELIIKKLLDLCVFIASNKKGSEISITIERSGKDIVIIQITTTCARIKQENIADLFVPYYGNIYKNTNLYLGSGLEGYLIKKSSNMINIPIDTEYNEDLSRLTFTVTIKKNFFDSNS